MTNLRLPDTMLFGLVYLSLATVLGFSVLGQEDAFTDGFAAEDGPIEYASSLFLFLSALVLGRRAARLFASGRTTGGALVGLYALLFLFGAGEEISWGQRIFGIETPEALKDLNVQGELTLHNLEWGDTHIAHTIFGTGLAAAILLYLVALPLLYPRVGWIARLTDALMVPVPALRHAVGTISASLVMVAVDMSRQWEVYEFVFSLLALSVFLYPVNARRFAPAAVDAGQAKAPPAGRRRFS